MAQAAGARARAAGRRWCWPWAATPACRARWPPSPCGCPLVVAEQNAVPGAANRLVGRFAKASAVLLPGHRPAPGRRHRQPGAARDPGRRPRRRPDGPRPGPRSACPRAGGWSPSSAARSAPCASTGPCWARSSAWADRGRPGRPPRRRRARLGRWCRPSGRRPARRRRPRLPAGRATRTAWTCCWPPPTSLVCRAGGNTVAELAVGRACRRCSCRCPAPPATTRRPTPGHLADAGGGRAGARRRARRRPAGRRGRRAAGRPAPGWRPWAGRPRGVGRRDAAEPGGRPRRGARPPRDRRRLGARRGRPVDLRRPRRIHVVGVGGAGMSAIAAVLAAMGHRVSGSDLQAVGRRSTGCGASASTPSVGHDARQRRAGRRRRRHLHRHRRRQPRGASRPGRRSVPVLRRADVLAAICRRPPHDRRGRHPRQDDHVVAARPGPGRRRPATRRSSSAARSSASAPAPGGTTASGSWSRPTRATAPSSSCRARSAVVTSVEPDHLEHYGELRRRWWTPSTASSPTPPAAAWCAPTTPAPPRSARPHGGRCPTAPRSAADIRMVEVVGGRSSVRFGLLDHGRPLGEVEVPLPGLHNARNAAAALIARRCWPGPPFDGGGRASAGFGRRRPPVPGPGRAPAASPSSTTTPTSRARWRPRWPRPATAGGSGSSASSSPTATAAPRPCGADFADAVRRRRPARRHRHLRRRRGAPARRHRPAGRRRRPRRPPAAPGGVRCPSGPTWCAYLRRVLRPGDLCLTLGAGDLTTLPDELLAE